MKVVYVSSLGAGKSCSSKTSRRSLC